MRTQIFTKILLSASIILSGEALAGAQERLDPSNPPQSPSKISVDTKPNMLARLGLAREQIQQIRRLNAERKPVMQAAQLRFRELNRMLDEAIYADTTDEALIEVRLKDVQSAQAEIQRIRYQSELSIRRILTPEQLIRFRELRQRFERGNVREPSVNRGQERVSTDPSNTQPIRQFLKQKRQRTVQ